MAKQEQDAILVKEKRLRLTSPRPQPLYGQPPWEGHSACAEADDRDSVHACALLATAGVGVGRGEGRGLLGAQEGVGKGRDGAMTQSVRARCWAGQVRAVA